MRVLKALAASMLLAAAGAASVRGGKDSKVSGKAFVNNRPIIGILSLPNSVPGFDSFKSYFPASYVKWLESAGARVVPLLYDAPADEIKQTLQYINGAFFTGGGTDFTNPDGTLTQFAQTASVIFNESVEAWTTRGEVFPLWGTCQGHELVSFLAAGANETVLSSGFDSENLTLPLTFTPAAQSSRLYGSLGQDIINIFSTQAVTMNNHQMGVLPSDVPKYPTLNNRFSVLSTNVDRAGKPFVSSMEGKNGLPIFTTQYHPEKVQFEWWIEEVINHSYSSVLANHWLSLIFVNQTRSSPRVFPSPQAESSALIYNYNPTYVGYPGGPEPGFEQVYLFDAAKA